MVSALLSLDGGILLWIQEFLRCPGLDAILIPFSNLGNAGMIWIVPSLLMLCFPKTRRMGMLTLLAVLIGVLVTNLTIKPWVARPRPWLSVEGLLPLLTPSDHSFPSGHTTAAFAAAGIWYRMLPKRWMRLAVGLLAVLMGFSRLYLGVHFPSDVLAGMCVGLLGSWLVWSLAKTQQTRGKQA